MFILSLDDVFFFLLLKARSTSDAEEGLLFMQEMVELSKLQSQQPDAAPQGVSFIMKDATGVEHLTTLQAGPSHFGVNLKGDQKVTGRPIIIHPFKACGELPQGAQIAGKIAVMERGDCMFVDKARRIQKEGAIGGIIIDNTPESSAENSPMFSMSGDGTDDIKIPVVFLFAQDAFKLLLTLSKDPSIQVIISELKNSADVWPPNEEESMFHKLKVSVQEFLNKHTGIAFTKTIAVGNFKADIGPEKIRITHDKGSQEVNPSETVTNLQWSQIRKGLLRSVLERKELFVPLNILKVYYLTLSGATSEELKEHDVAKQSKWLLTELAAEHYKKDDDILVTVEKDDRTSLLEGISEISETNAKIIRETQQGLDKLNTLLQVFSAIEKDVMDKLKSSDELVVRDERQSPEKVILTKGQLESENNNSDKTDRKNKHAADEL